MTKQQLNGADVGAGLQQMDSERVSQTMGRDGLGQSGETSRLLAGMPHGIPGDRLTGMIARKEPLLWPARLPVAAQGVQQLGREHHVAVFLPFALLHANHHSLTVDGRGLQVNRFRDA